MFRVPLFYWKEFLITTPDQDNIPLELNYDYKSGIWKLRLNGSLVSTFSESREDFQSRIRYARQLSAPYLWVADVNEGFVKKHLSQTAVKFEKCEGVYLRCLLVDDDRISSISFCDGCSVCYGEYEWRHGRQTASLTYDGKNLPAAPIMDSSYTGQNIYGLYMVGNTRYYVLDVVEAGSYRAIRPSPTEFDHPITEVLAHVAWIDKGTLMTGHFYLHSRNDGQHQRTYPYGTNKKQRAKFGRYLDLEEQEGMPTTYLCSNFPICKNVEDVRDGLQETLNGFDYLYQRIK